MKIFLSQSYISNYRTHRILYIVMGAFFIFSNIGKWIRFDGTFSVELLFNGVYFLAGVFAVFYGAVLLSPKFKYAPRFEFSSQGILIKKDVFVKSDFVFWNDVKKIKYGFYEISFTIKGGGISVFPIYTKNSDNSIAVKEEITRWAEKLGIEVVAG